MKHGCEDTPGHGGVRVLEFFSGIGGMRASLAGAQIPVKEVTAYDTSPICNRTYELNFAGAEEKGLVRTKLVEQLQKEELEGADLWTMSPFPFTPFFSAQAVISPSSRSKFCARSDLPDICWRRFGFRPCQPFSTTKAANRRDADDPRCAGLKHLLSVLSCMQQPPRWLLLENVKGFVGSEMHRELLETVRGRGYSFRQFLLSPVHFGMPNNRMRYYLLCERGDRWRQLDENEISSTPPLQAAEQAADQPEAASRGKGACEEGGQRREALGDGSGHGVPETQAGQSERRREEGGGAQRDAEEQRGGRDSGGGEQEKEEEGEEEEEEEALAGCAGEILQLKHFLEDPQGLVCRAHALVFGADASLSSRSPQAEVLLSPATLVKPWAQGLSYVGPFDRITYCFTGSYGKVMHKSSGSILHPAATQALATHPLDRQSLPSYHGSLRLFTPREILSVMGFPPAFFFPDDLSLRHRYKLVGNSISVTVVTCLMSYLLSEAKGAEAMPRP